MKRCCFALVLAAAWHLATPLSCWSAPPPTRSGPITFLQQFGQVAGPKTVPFVAVAIGKGLSQLKPPIPFSGRPLKAALQDVGAAYSESVRDKLPKALAEEFEADREVYIPFEFDRVWTIARDLQWVVNVDPPTPDYLTASEPAVLLSDLVRSLTADQWRAAGSPGLSLRDLSEEQQKVFRAVFTKPVVLWQFLPGDPANHAPRMTNDFDGKVDVDRARLHVFTGWRDIAIFAGPEGMGINYPLQPFEGYVRFARSPGAVNGYTTPAVLSEPAHLKKGDLNFDAATLLAPIGLSGETRVDKIVAAASKTSRLALKVDPRLAGYSVYVGDPKLRTGDVLRALAFDLQGAFRKVGKTYVLTFDRIGLGALRMALDERMMDIDQSRDKARDGLLGLGDKGDWWRDALRLLGPDPDGPPGPTPEQVAILTRPSKPETGTPVIRFPDLTTEQQASVRKDLREGAWLMRDLDLSDPKSEEALQKAYFSDVDVRVVLEVSGGGRYTVQDNVPVINPSTEQAVKAQRDGKAVPPPERPENSSISLKVKDRAVAVPPLRASEWPRLFAQMRRKGIGTLYLPVVWDGYALFPSHQFPLLPSANGKDVLAGVLAQAKAGNIKVIGVVHTLSWRFPGGKPAHWLNGHPELVSRDLLGRRRWEWTKKRVDAAQGAPLFRWLPANDPLSLGDMVVPGDPRVRGRLGGLLDELKGYPGISGVAFAEWSRLTAGTISGYSPLANQIAPLLGYSEAEREAFLLKEGVDPVDVTRGYQSAEIPYTRFERAGQDEIEKKLLASVFASDADLVNSLTAQAEKAWPGRVTLFYPFGQVYAGDRKAYPKADARLRFRPEPEESLPSDAVWVAPGCDLSAIPADENLSAWRTQFAWADTIRAAVKSPALNAVVLDFRNAPDMLWDGLNLLENAKGPR